MRRLFFLALCVHAACEVPAQVSVRRTFYDPEKKHPKEIYEVADTSMNVLHGRYISYYLNGNIESKGQFTDNETSGVWEFFYETGTLKMRGILRQHTNAGLWQYFYESGRVSMHGHIDARKREGEWISFYENGQVKEKGNYEQDRREGSWKTFFEDGTRKSEIEYKAGAGVCTEYFSSGKIRGQGPMRGHRAEGRWRYFGEDGHLREEGDLAGGARTGLWTAYHPDGATESRGQYANNQPVGSWEYFYEDGAPHTTGTFDHGKKTGTWRSFYRDGTVRSESVIDTVLATYAAFHPGGSLKIRGETRNGRREGRWMFYYPDGATEGICDYQSGKGTYTGYFRDGKLHTRGQMDGELRTGTWQIYEATGNLSGYYRPFYDGGKLEQEIVALSGNVPGSKHGRRSAYFQRRVNESQGLIAAGNPLMMFAGRLPLAVEFYFQERLGHEFEFVGIRDPFFVKDNAVPEGEVFERGYAVTLRQKLYNPLNGAMWYFGHEIRFTNVAHFVHLPDGDVFTPSAVEQRIAWGPVLGCRLMPARRTKGLTLDAFVAGNIGYRGFNADPDSAPYFGAVPQAPLAIAFQWGLHAGYIFR